MHTHTHTHFVPYRRRRDQICRGRLPPQICQNRSLRPFCQETRRTEKVSSWLQVPECCSVFLNANQILSGQNWSKPPLPTRTEIWPSVSCPPQWATPWCDILFYPTAWSVGTRTTSEIVRISCFLGPFVWEVDQLREPNRLWNKYILFVALFVCGVELQNAGIVSVRRSCAHFHHCDFETGHNLTKALKMFSITE